MSPSHPDRVRQNYSNETLKSQAARLMSHEDKDVRELAGFVYALCTNPFFGLDKSKDLKVSTD